MYIVVKTCWRISGSNYTRIEWGFPVHIHLPAHHPPLLHPHLTASCSCVGLFTAYWFSSLATPKWCSLPSSSVSLWLPVCPSAATSYTAHSCHKRKTKVIQVSRILFVKHCCKNLNNLAKFIMLTAFARHKTSISLLLYFTVLVKDLCLWWYISQNTIRNNFASPKPKNGVYLHLHSQKLTKDLEEINQACDS